MLREEFAESYRQFEALTMTGPKKFCATLLLAKALRLRMEDHAVVETGVWKGGMSLALMKHLPDCEEFHLFDSFEGLPEPTERDGRKAQQLSELNLFAARRNYASHEELLRKVDELGYTRRAQVHKGWFEETVDADRICRPIALLRMDGDWYASTYVVLDRLFDRVATGGVIILDDYYDWPGCRQAIHDFLSRRMRTEPLRVVDNTLAYILKEPDNALHAPVGQTELRERMAMNRLAS